MAKCGTKGPKQWSTLGKWAYEFSGFNQYGLHHNDCMSEDLCPNVKEAVRRLPRHLYDIRNFRVIRALHLSMIKQILPVDQWTKYEEDHKYLDPYLEEVIKEREEREKWNNNH